MLKLPSPELEKLIMQQNGLLSATPTPGGFVYPTPTSTGNTNSSSSSNNNNNPRAVTRDQEMYVRGFDDALAELHQQAGAQQQQQQQVQILSGGQQQPNHHSLLETGSSISSNNAQAAAPFAAAAARPPTSLSPYPNTAMHQVTMPTLFPTPFFKGYTMITITPVMATYITVVVSRIWGYVRSGVQFESITLRTMKQQIMRESYFVLAASSSFLFNTRPVFLLLKCNLTYSFFKFL
jgi:hypothetical protein